MRIIVDVMSGDNAPHEILRGVFAADDEFSASYILVGDREIIEKTAEECGHDIRRFEIVHTDEVITMEDDPICVVRAKKESSMSTGLRLLSEGKGDVFVSAGNSGALFTGASLIVRKIRGIQRAAIASVLPFDPPVMLLDSGANLVVTEENLAQFAVMGSTYMKNYYGVEDPRVGLLNNGTEECKGTELRVSAYKFLSAYEKINFVGNVEANHLPFDTCDVVVTDGFCGNILLKCVEGMGKMVMGELVKLFKASPVSMVSAVMVKSKLREIKHKYDPTEYGGAPILGISKPVIKAHGSSNAKAFKNAIRQAIACVDTGITYDIAKAAEQFRAERQAKKEAGDPQKDEQ